MNAHERASVSRGVEVRQRLRRAAVELVAELGWHAVSTRVLAERAGVGSGLVHYHFPSLQALLRDAVVEMMRDTLAEVGPALADASTVEDGIGALLGALDGRDGQNPAWLVTVEAYLASTRDPELRHDLTSVVMEFRSQLAGWLAARGEAEPERTAAVLAALIDGVLVHRALDPDLTAATVLPVVRKVIGAETEESR